MAEPVYWEPKDPDEAKNYSVDWGKDALEAGDTVLTSLWLNAVGGAVDANSISPDKLFTYARISGGVVGTMASFLNRITTTNGETLEQVVILPIVASTGVALLGEYETPTPAHLITTYPAFANVAYATIAAHIQGALGGVDTTWFAVDYPRAIMALAAHNMALLGIGTVDESEGYARKGVTSIRDGAFSVQFSDKRVADLTGGSWSASPYGRLYESLLASNKGGPRVIGGAVAEDYWGFRAVQNNGAILP